MTKTMTQDQKEREAFERHYAKTRNVMFPLARWTEKGAYSAPLANQAWEDWQAAVESTRATPQAAPAEQPVEHVPIEKECILNNLGDLKQPWDDLRTYVNATPELISLLYDLDLMPEQIHVRRNFVRMLQLAEWHKLYRAQDSSNPAPAHPVRAEVVKRGKLALGILGLPCWERPDGTFRPVEDRDIEAVDAALSALPPTRDDGGLVEGLGLPVEQEPKYTTNGHAIVNRASGEEIPADEPVFIFRARDVHAAAVLRFYWGLVDDMVHRQAVQQREAQFRKFWSRHPDRMKEPDTAQIPTPTQAKAGA